MLLESLTSELPVDALASCPLGDGTTHLMAVGGYSLEGNQRHGGLSIGSCHKDVSYTKGLKLSWRPYARLPYGVLDVKLKRERTTSDLFLLSFMGSDGALRLASLRWNDTSIHDHLLDPWLENIPEQIHQKDSSPIGLAMDVLTESSIHYVEGQTIPVAFGLSNGQVFYSSDILLRNTKDSMVTVTPHTAQVSIQAHDAEVWTVCIHPQSPETQLLTGGDDGQMKHWDLRTSLSKPTLVDCTHPMGVTCIVCMGSQIFSGCYDGILRVWDQRQMKAPLLNYETVSKSGIWRIQLRPLESSMTEILLAVTHGGSEICHKLSSDVILPFYTHQEHQSMVYGVASLCLTNEQEFRTSPLYVSGSFYDRLLTFWNVSP